MPGTGRAASRADKSSLLDYLGVKGAMRINQYLSSAGVSSRREADRLIREGRISINGVPAEIGARVLAGDEVLFDGREIRPLKNKVILAYYKPRGLVVTEDKNDPDSIMRFIDYPERVTYFGRLDKASEGLLLLSNDGELNQQLMKGRNRHEKEYIVTVNKEVTEDFLTAMGSGIYLPELKKKTRKCAVKRRTGDSFSIILTQGLNRQIRRMCESLGYRVKRLKRIRIENIHLGGMKPGELRELTPEEEKVLRAAALQKEVERS